MVPALSVLIVDRVRFASTCRFIVLLIITPLTTLLALVVGPLGLIAIDAKWLALTLTDFVDPEGGRVSIIAQPFIIDL